MFLIKTLSLTFLKVFAIMNTTIRHGISKYSKRTIVQSIFYYYVYFILNFPGQHSAYGYGNIIIKNVFDHLKICEKTYQIFLL